MLGVPGIAARTFAAVARTGASVLMISQASSEQSICFTILTDHSQQVIESLEEEMKLELLRQDIDRISSRDDVVNLFGDREQDARDSRDFSADFWGIGKGKY